MEIPKQLQNPDFRFVLLGTWNRWLNAKTKEFKTFTPEEYANIDKDVWKPRGKSPFEKDWQNTNNYRFSDIKLLEHIKLGKNYGVIGGYGDLRILDIDNPELAKEFKKKLNTFTIKTGSGGMHFYFISDYDKNHTLINKLGELRAKNSQVVCCPCRHPSGNYYEIINDVPIQEINSEHLLKLIKPYLRDEIAETKTTGVATTSDEKKQDTTRSGLEFRKLIALFRAGKTRAEILKIMPAYARWVSSPERYRQHQLDNAENFVLQEQENKDKKIKDNKPIFTEENKIKLKKAYDDIILILKEYMDLEEDYYSLISLWIIGTFFHKQFSSYPYLFFNAMKGSGKTRILKILANLCKNGKVAGSMTEAVLFRTAGSRTLCIDEIEGINAKGNENLRLLLNSAYKRGLVVERLRKRKTAEGDIQEVEEFEVFCPIALANIWGMDDILGDRCIKLILEKSSKHKITRLIENFENDVEFVNIKNELLKITDCLNNKSNLFGNVITEWNCYIKNNVNQVSIVSKVNEVNKVSNTYDTGDIYVIGDIFQVLGKTTIAGRDLELFFPLLIIANLIDDKLLDKLITTAEEVIKEKREVDREENKDVQLIEHIAESNYIGETNISLIVSNLQEKYGQDEKWINSRGISRALKRLNLILSRSSTGKQRQVKLNTEKAKDKLLMFKEVKVS